MPLNPDFEEFIHHLNAAQVEYMVVGAYAVIIYTEPRYTKDIAFLIRPESKNAKKVYKALKAFGAPLTDITIEDLCNPEMIYQVGLEPNRIDILMGIEGISFDKLWNNKQTKQYGKENLFVISPEDLVETKKIAGRPQDLLDVAKLQRTVKIKS